MGFCVDEFGFGTARVSPDQNDGIAPILESGSEVLDQVSDHCHNFRPDMVARQDEYIS